MLKIIISLLLTLPALGHAGAGFRFYAGTTTAVGDLTLLDNGRYFGDGSGLTGIGQGQITGALSSTTTIPGSLINLSTYTFSANLSGVRYTTDTVQGALIVGFFASTNTLAINQLSGVLSSTTTIPGGLLNLSTYTFSANLSGVRYTTDTVQGSLVASFFASTDTLKTAIPQNLIDLSTVTTALSGKLDNAVTVPTNLIDLSTVTSALNGVAFLASTQTFSGGNTFLSSITIRGIMTSTAVNTGYYAIAGSTVLAESSTILKVGMGAGKVATGTNSTYVGYQAGMATILGDKNTFVGATAGFANITGSGNNFFGYNSGELNISGGNNIGIGWGALLNNVIGNNNVCIGNQAGLGSLNISFSSSTVLGYQAGFSLTTGDKNTFIGDQSGYNVTSGTGNIIIGYGQLGVSNLFNSLNIGGLILGDFTPATSSVTINGKLYTNGNLYTNKVQGSTATFTGSVTASYFSGFNIVIVSSSCPTANVCESSCGAGTQIMSGSCNGNGGPLSIVNTDIGGNKQSCRQESGPTTMIAVANCGHYQ